MAALEDAYDEQTKRFFRDIGLSTAQRRMSMLETKSRRLRTRGRGACSSSACDSHLAKQGSYVVASATRASPRHSVDIGPGALTVLDEGAQHLEQVSSKSPRSPEALPSSPPSPPGSTRATREVRLKEELEEAKRELHTRVHAFRNELVEDMRSHQVSLQERPTVEELEDPKTKNVKLFRRHHLKVVVGSDEREIRKMPNHKLCISEDIKNSLSKMRENLFQRKLNLAIYEKTIGDWTMPNMHKEVRRRRRKSPTSNQSPATTGLQTSTHVDMPSTTEPIPVPSNIAVTTTSAVTGVPFASVAGEDPS